MWVGLRAETSLKWEVKFLCLVKYCIMTKHWTTLEYLLEVLSFAPVWGCLPILKPRTLSIDEGDIWVSELSVLMLWR